MDNVDRGAASVSLDSGTLTVGAAQMPAALVSAIIVAGGDGDDTLTVTDVDVPVTFAAGEGDGDAVVGSDAETEYSLTGVGSGGYSVGSTTATAVSFSSVEAITAGTADDAVVLPAATSVRFTGVGAATIRDSFNVLVADVTGVDEFDARPVPSATRPVPTRTIGTLTVDTDDRFVVETEAHTPTLTDEATAATDTLTVSGEATLAGTLEIRSTTGPVAGVTTASPYLSAATVDATDDTFDTFVGLDLGGGSYVVLSRDAGPPVELSLAAAALPRDRDRLRGRRHGERRVRVPVG